MSISRYPGSRVLNRKSLVLALLLFAAPLVYAVSTYDAATLSPSPLKTADEFAVGSRVTVDVLGTRVRWGPSITYNWLGTQNPDSIGTITQPCQPDHVSIRVFCGVDFAVDPDGWVPTEHLVLISDPPPTPTPTPEPTSTLTPEPTPTLTPEPSPATPAMTS